MARTLFVLALATLCGCSTAWSDRYNPADVSHRRTAELCREGTPSDQDFARCMEELLPPTW